MAEAVVKLYDASGRLVKSQVFTGHTVIDTVNMPHGFYLACIAFGSYSESRKIIIK